MNKATFLFFLSLVVFVISSCADQASNAEKTKVGDTKVDTNRLYKVVVSYPKTDSTRFDMEYYEKNHMPMMARILGDNLHYYEIDNGDIETTNRPVYVAACSFYVGDMKLFTDSVSAHADSVGKDIPKYTNEKPVIQTFTTKRFDKW